MIYSEQQLLALVETGDVVQESEIETLFNKLRPVSAKLMIGSWIPGPYVETGHPGVQELKEAGWDGKTFYSEDHVAPVMSKNRDGTRAMNEKFGLAVLRPMEFRGVLSVAMIYDNLPIIDHFRYVTDDIIFGIMDTKMFPKENGMLYFSLKRSTM
ncbi:hypothetical protein INT45_013526 [Circinella minor]|uniref:Uncharacterized protein n=1 Tax=Circinella minor TaxID=1195481 RepID=A0A8H7S543_9FUNG|nr:hypothetical protein INT45_013526 [Circinella minor]